MDWSETNLKICLQVKKRRLPLKTVAAIKKLSLYSFTNTCAGGRNRSNSRPDSLAWSTLSTWSKTWIENWVTRLNIVSFAVFTGVAQCIPVGAISPNIMHRVILEFRSVAMYMSRLTL